MASSPSPILPPSTPPPARSRGAVGCFRTLLAFVIASVVATYGVGAGVYLIRERDARIEQFAGIFVVGWALVFTRFVYRKIRG